jgi:hypothetical protein
MRIMRERSVFAELMEGVGAMKEHREGKLTLPTHKSPTPKTLPLKRMDSEEVGESQSRRAQRLEPPLPTGDHRASLLK